MIGSNSKAAFESWGSSFLNRETDSYSLKEVLGRYEFQVLVQIVREFRKTVKQYFLLPVTEYIRSWVDEKLFPDIYNLYDTTK